MKDGIIFTILVILWTVIKLVFKLLAVVVKVLASLIIFFGLYIPLFYGVFGIVLLATTEFTFGGVGTDQILYYIGLGLSCIAAVIISIRNLIIRPLSSVFAPFLEYRDELKKSREKDEKDEKEEEKPQQQPYDPRGYDPYYYGQNGYYPPYGGSPASGNPYDPSYGAPRPHAPYYQGEAQPTDNYAPRPLYGYGQSPAPYYGGQEPPHENQNGNGGVYPPVPERPLIYYSKRRPGILVKEYSDRFELFEETDGTRRYVGTEYKDE